MENEVIVPFAGLYIHIPFCPRKCGYCNFYSVAALNLIPEFLAALHKEMEICSCIYDFSTFDTLYVGGGSPSILPADRIEEILSHAHDVFAILPDAEITVEVNPGDIDLHYLKNLHDIGVNRINIGVQSFDERVLAFLERRHSRQEALDAIISAKQAGFDNIGLDLIHSIPGQSMVSWLDTLSIALSFKPAHFSCYQLTVESETPLGKRLAGGALVMPDNDEQYQFFMTTAETLEAAGYIHYEVSNFAASMNLASRHNQKYWDHTPYLGLGPAAHSFKDNKRWWNHQSLKKYINDLKTEKIPIEDSELLTEEQLQLETLLLGLRTKKGINLRSFRKRFGHDLLREKGETLADLNEAGLITIEDDCIRPTRTGLAVADSLSLI